MANRVLLAEDDRATRESLVRALELDGYEVRAVGDGAAALDAFEAEIPDVVVLDLMMPNVDGLTVCRRLRARAQHAPILIATARTEVSDRVSGLDAGADGACVNLGGDVRVAGTPPEESWAIAIDHPSRAEPAAVVHLQRGAVATSSRLNRRWETDHGFAHHLIDPRRGVPADAAVGTATALAATGWQAEVLAKASFLAGLGRGLELLDSIGAAGLLIDEDGAVLATRSFTRFADLPARIPQEAIR